MFIIKHTSWLSSHFSALKIGVYFLVTFRSFPKVLLAHSSFRQMRIFVLRYFHNLLNFSVEVEFIKAYYRGGKCGIDWH